MSDHYQLLGVNKDSTALEIKKAYKKLASQYHPDKVECLGPKLKDFASDEMRRLNEARDTLLDPKRKDEYDRSLVTDRPRPPQGAPQTPASRYNFKCPHCQSIVVAVPMDRPYVTNCPACKGGMTIPAIQGNGGGQVPVWNGGPRPPDRLNIYREAVRRALIDGIITNDEMSILDGLRAVLSINPNEHQQTLLSVRASMGR